MPFASDAVAVNEPAEYWQPPNLKIVLPLTGKVKVLPSLNSTPCCAPLKLAASESSLIVIKPYVPAAVIVSFVKSKL